MKRILMVSIIILLSMVMVYGAYAIQDVVNTKHNLSTTPSTATRTFYLLTGTDEVCVFCHTPHFSSTTQQPLWNRQEPAGPFTMYSSATIDMTIASAPQGVSLACLSCHDGVTAFDALLNFPGSGSTTPTDWTWNNNENTLASSTYANIGTDLSNDHPISITYDTTADTAFNAPDPTTGKILVNSTPLLPLYGANKDQVECGTCHDPHERDNPTFLRVANTGSQLCLACHIK